MNSRSFVRAMIRRGVIVYRVPEPCVTDFREHISSIHSLSLSLSLEHTTLRVADFRPVPNADEPLVRARSVTDRTAPFPAGMHSNIRASRLRHLRTVEALRRRRLLLLHRLRPTPPKPRLRWRLSRP
jgi:hypothetical protein